MHTSTFGHKFGSLSPAVTLKIRSWSPKPNQLFIMSQCYIHANAIKIRQPVHEISCKQESVTPTPTPTPTLMPTPTGSAPKTICPPPLRWGTYICIVHTWFKRTKLSSMACQTLHYSIFYIFLFYLFIAIVYFYICIQSLFISIVYIYIYCFYSMFDHLY